ncbi:class I SAM-dependent methyltransferase [Catenuloplanes atrovinosus]|uniref:SAM-dependent methyltransferase n=1 Tax=Catenuloplanes atrovinosus TaxID=137266 RepID=A0AAE3YRM4_9ACTN|nr:class I SAM-dependent methyltransferase [Catenuloplanes atrovinosus]MDR7277420.1 SAM-dependent methyltransferase [Catenuloplanes atrovinosus]
MDTLWNGRAGDAWTRAQGLLDALFLPLERLLVEPVTGGDVLDVGCGTGATTVAVARRAGRCTGVDVSARMIEAARDRGCPEATFIVADAQEHAFVPASFDLVMSRFGVMFFADPVRAFANLRRAARPGAGLRCLVWRSAAENPFMTTAEHAAAPLLPGLPPRRPDGPGQFAFAEPDRVSPMLREAGWRDVAFTPVDVECAMPESELTGYFTRLGPVGLVLADADEATRAAVVEAVRPAFAPYVHADEVRFTAACWLLTAVS